mmetsp:Transcript_7592/g.13059  ORF Transcript_7592/g.13059 Transcript_7592/m.13059 type:complete len:86 (-) Transcript_7592:501-758(-)|eukprot:CAMPEP_0198208714 /NCGR_PEP_ID=MMETSP1445-20131203/12063_1 /TAXON_ID=36898 /ORGANISM="Pyramimonas sp., Strain CCMP2087" /LENGTH=85 /DNA_ID=CAMNT_0043882227 /DNA_START=285 /DNA_END=542 /DNA_ORIENTATION=+
MFTGPPLFPPLVPRTIEYLVSEDDEEALLTNEEAKLEAQWAAIRQAHAQLWYPGKHSAQSNQVENEPVEDDDEEIEEESEGDDFE